MSPPPRVGIILLGVSAFFIFLCQAKGGPNRDGLTQRGIVLLGIVGIGGIIYASIRIARKILPRDIELAIFAPGSIATAIKAPAACLPEAIPKTPPPRSISVATTLSPFHIVVPTKAAPASILPAAIHPPRRPASETSSCNDSGRESFQADIAANKAQFSSVQGELRSVKAALGSTPKLVRVRFELGAAANNGGEELRKWALRASFLSRLSSNRLLHGKNPDQTLSSGPWEEALGRLSHKPGVIATIILDRWSGTVLQRNSTSNAASPFTAPKPSHVSKDGDQDPTASLNDADEFSTMVWKFMNAAGSLVNDLDSEDEVKLLRLRTKKNELVIVPDAKYILIVVHEMASS